MLIKLIQCLHFHVDLHPRMFDSLKVNGVLTEKEVTI